MTSKVGLALNKVAAKIGTKVAPKAFPETCSIQTFTRSTSGGKTTKGTVTDAYEDVPMAYKAFRGGSIRTFAGRDVSMATHLLTIPTQKADGTRIEFDITTNYRIVTDTRGTNTPEKVFRSIAFYDEGDIDYKIIAEKEN